MIYRIFTGCYIVAALVLVAACNDGLDIQTKYPFTVETMPVPKELKVNETAEIRCELKREGRWEDTRYTIRWFLFDGEGTLKLDDGTVLLIEKYDLPQLEVRTSADEVYTPPVSNAAVDVPQEYAAALAFNAEMQRAADALDASAQEALAMAREHYDSLDAEQRAYWANYAEELIVDDICQFSGLVSVWGVGYSNYGGAHGWESIRAWSFDLTTGEFLTLDGLDAQPSTDSALGESLTHTLAMAVLEQIDAQGLSEYYFEDYASYIFDLAANASFYFNDKGMTIVFDPAVIAPYAASAQKFEIPYSRFYNALDAHTQSLLDVPQDEIIIADYYTTKTLWSWFNMTTPPVDSGAPGITVDGLPLARVTLGDVNTLDELRALLCEHVSAELADEWLAEDERQFQLLWKNYFRALAIPQRINERQQRRMMPRRYWKHLTEME